MFSTAQFVALSAEYTPSFPVPAASLRVLSLSFSSRASALSNISPLDPLQEWFICLALLGEVSSSEGDMFAHINYHGHMNTTAQVGLIPLPGII